MQFKDAAYEILKSSNTNFARLEIQRELVARIEGERKIVVGTREVISLYGEKVKKMIE